MKIFKINYIYIVSEVKFLLLKFSKLPSWILIKLLLFKLFWATLSSRFKLMLFILMLFSLFALTGDEILLLLLSSSFKGGILLFSWRAFICLFK